MKHFKINTKRGIISYLVVIIIAIILIAYFRNDVRNLLNSAQVKDALLTAINWIQQALLWIIGKLGWTASQIK